MPVRRKFSSSPQAALDDFEAAERAVRSAGVEKSDAIADVLYLQAATLNILGRQNDAVERDRAAIVMNAGLHGALARRTSYARQHLGELYATQERWRLAYETFAAVAPTVDTYTDESDAKDVASFDIAYAAALTKTSRFGDASARLLSALRLRAAAFGNRSMEVAETFERDGALEAQRGNYATSFSRYETAAGLAVALKADDTAEMARIGIGIGTDYHATGDFGHAEPPLRFALNYGKTHGATRFVKDASSELSMLLIDEGRISEGVDVLVASMPELADTPLPRATPVPVHTQDPETSIADMKTQNGRIEGDYGADTLEYVRSLMELEGLQVRAKHFEDARSTLARADAILQRIVKPEHPLRGDVLRARADVELQTGDLDASDRDDTAAVAIFVQQLGKNVERTIDTQLHLGAAYLKADRYADARPLILTAADSSLKNFQTSAAYASESDRVDYVRFSGSFAYDAVMQMCWDHCAADPDLVQRSLNYTLGLKGAIARNVRDLRTRIATAGGDSLRRFDAIRALRARIAALRFAGDFGETATQEKIKTLTDQANLEEGRLSRDSAAYAASLSGKSATWHDVAGRLDANDAAIVMTRTPFKDSPYRYLAFVIRRDGPPAAVPLTDEDTLEGKPLASYRALEEADERAAAPPLSGALYDAVWKPLEPSLAGAKRIFVAPDGDLSQINLAVMPDDSGRMLFESRDVRVVSSLSDLLYARAPKAAGGSPAALLVGDPDFGARPDGATVATVTRDAVRSVDLRDVKTALVSPLPGTRREIEDVGALLRAHDWRVTKLVGDGATKAAIERARSPRVMHLATHGFFLDPPSQHVYGTAAFDDDPMLRSGLLLAGATESLRREDASASGILTAFEASNLRLDGTELVVLSACDTGLGTVELSDGVFGLRRAFHEAGASNVMMSMWTVPDRETHELMKSFYRYWLGGAEMHAALARAMRDERAVVVGRYGKDLPRMWGAFVIDG